MPESNKTSSGLLIYRMRNSKLEVFIVHPGGPFWRNKDQGAWSIPKGEMDGEENMLDAAIRETHEETGIVVRKESNFISLGSVKQKSGKVVYAWAVEGDWSGLLICSSYAVVEWPYKSGKMIKVPEVDKAGFFDLEKAREKLNDAQKEFLERLKGSI